ncbi:hypothetical protein TUM17379_22630 [Shewanella algae]|uniref:Uncharacterized protein n=1 Tax=Shewanella algae TaxID=38313 RepID=A0AAD1NP88_9GAMM|nr:hypothetical protein TUM17379_22630 [Shewanella algae]
MAWRNKPQVQPWFRNETLKALTDGKTVMGEGLMKGPKDMAKGIIERDSLWP